jgi:hypothetical protein
MKNILADTKKYPTFAPRFVRVICIFAETTIIPKANKTMSPLIEFVKNGIAVLSEASRGNYRSNNKELEELGKDLFKEPKHEPASSTDKRRILSDSKRVAADARKVISNYQF